MDLQEKMDLFINEDIDKRKMLDELRKLKRRIEEAEAIVKAGESPYQHLSIIKSDITDLFRNVKKYKGAI